MIRLRRRRRQGALGQRRAHRRLDQVPGHGDFAADVDPRRIEHVDHRRQAEAEIARRAVECRRRLGITRAGARNQVFDGEVALLHRRRAAVIGRAAEVAGQRRRVRDVGLPAAIRSARTARSVERQRQVAEFTGNVVAAAQHFAVDHHADADAVGNADEHQVAVGAAEVLAHRPGLRQRAGAAGVFDLHGHAESPPPAPRAG